MTQIENNQEICTVVITVDTDTELMGEIESCARHGQSQFEGYKGFISGALHKSRDGRRLVQYLQWDSEECHWNCINDPRWNEIPSSRRFRELVESGRVRTDVRIYQVLEVSNGPPPAADTPE